MYVRNVSVVACMHAMRVCMFVPNACNEMQCAHVMHAFMRSMHAMQTCKLCDVRVRVCIVAYAMHV